MIAKRRCLYLIPAAFCAGYVVTLALGPCLAVRYMLPVMVCCPVLLAATLRGMQ